MKSYQATWEDAEASRQVELVVNYRLDAKRVDINDVTPTRVTFLCQQDAEAAPHDPRLDRRRPQAARPPGRRRRPARHAWRKRSPKASSTSSSTPSTAPRSKPRRSCRPKQSAACSIENNEKPSTNWSAAFFIAPR